MMTFKSSSAGMCSICAWVKENASAVHVGLWRTAGMMGRINASHTDDY